MYIRISITFFFLKNKSKIGSNYLYQKESEIDQVVVGKA